MQPIEKDGDKDRTFENILELMQKVECMYL